MKLQHSLFLPKYLTFWLPRSKKYVGKTISISNKSIVILTFFYLEVENEKHINDNELFPFSNQYFLRIMIRQKHHSVW